jgi:hypothetical protein|tara:strand:- start:539 stop:955 length:417 start_codon:yes stop_codon:yes gene_type:complete
MPASKGKSHQRRHLSRPHTEADDKSSSNEKLRDLLLGLIARRDYYNAKLSTTSRASGELLMRVLLGELASSAHACALDSAVISAKMRLDALASTVMRSASPTEFVALRDELTTLLLDLPREQRHTAAQIFHLYESVGH